MTTFKTYLAYRLKKTGMTTLVFSLISVIFTLFIVMKATDKHYDAQYYGETGIYILAIVLGVFSTVIPMLETADFKNRRNLDTLYFLPISRFKLALAHYISGFVQVILIYTASFFAAAMYLIGYVRYFKLSYLPLYYIASLFIGLIMYSFFMFIFGEANTVADGVIFCVLWIFVICFAWDFVGTSVWEYFEIFWTDFRYNVYRIYNIPIVRELYDIYIHIAECYEWGIVYMPINNLTMIFQNLMEDREDYFVRSVETIISQSYMFFVWAAIGVASAYGYFKTFIRKSTEKAGEISDSFVGYKFLVPFYGYTLLVMDISDVFSVFALVMMVVGYAFYRRGVKFKKSDIIFLLVGLVVPILGGIIAFILFFGSPALSGAGIGASIYYLSKIIKKKKEIEEKLFKRKVRKYISGIVICFIIFVISVAAIIVSSVLAILN
ncbi:MAG: hypothetical protein IJX55_10025 [Clostridia bacterium]|nr:hypothetical protein [Clostridia bacterium]